MVCYIFSVTPKPINGKVPIESFFLDAVII